MHHVLRLFPNNIERAERRRVVMVITVALLVLSLPYLWALAITPPGYTYTGLLYNPDDQNVHLAWAKQAPAHVTIRDLFTTESQDSGEPARFVNLFCFALGAIATITHLPPVVVYHVLRLLFAALCLHWFYLLCSRLTEDRRVRLVALVLAAFAMGSGWLQDALPGIFRSHIFIDRADATAMPMMPEAFTFASAFVFPLNIAAMALLVLVFLKVLEAQAGEGRNPAVKAAIATFVLTNIHTYDAIPLAATLVVWVALSWKRTGTAKAWATPLAAMIGMLPPLLYQAWVFRGSEEFRIKALTPTPAPPLGDVLWSYGLLVVLAVIGAGVSWRARGTWLALCWSVLVLALIYAPVSFARKMIEGLHLPLCFLAALGLCHLIGLLRERLLRRVVLGAALCLLCASTGQFVVWCLQNAQDNNRSRLGVLMPPLYLTEGDAAALRHLNTLPAGAAPDVVLALPFVGNYTPRETGRFTYAGHWAETLDFRRKFTEAARYYEGRMTDPEALAWLRQRHIDYVIEGSYERMFAEARGGVLPSRRLGLKPVFSKDQTTVYEVAR